MPSTDIVRGIRTLTQKQLMPAVPLRWQRQFTSVCRPTACRPSSQPVVMPGWLRVKHRYCHAQERTSVCKNKLANQLGSAFDASGLVKPTSFVNIDHSDMNGLTALVGAVQTRKGRAIPCMVETTYSDRLPARDDVPPRKKALRAARTKARKAQSFTGHTIDALQDLADRLGFWPRLVFDRGFGNESIVEHLCAEGAIFYIRVKAGRYVEYDGQRTEIQQLKEKDATIQLFGLKLRVIRSPKDGKNKEPWYILTNDLTSSRTKIVRIYYHRFEIEETFKDIKHIFELKRTRLNKPLSLKLLLWFVALGIALLYLVTKPTKRQLTVAHIKKQTSWLRQAYELLQQATNLMLWDQG